MNLSLFSSIISVLIVTFTMFTSQVFAEWTPPGPIKLMIGFAAGGGTDTQARLLAKELENIKGWRVIPENVAGAGGAVMAARLKKQPADGTSIGLALDTTFSFASINNDELSLGDFTYITTTAASQTGVIARTDSGWKTLADVAKDAKAGTKIIWTNYSAQTQLASEVIARHLGINVNHVRGKGGKAGVNSLVAKDANLAWGGGAQRGLVAAGELAILVSAESSPLVQNPEGQTLKDIGIAETFGFKFVLAAPAGLPSEVRDSIASAVASIITNKESETAKFIAKQYPPAAVVVAGDNLKAMIESQFTANRKLLTDFSK